MHSFVALGDVGVYALTGQSFHGDFEELPRLRSPVLYEGAALVGMSLERALAQSNQLDQARVCRYLTPLDNFESPVLPPRYGEKYPFGNDSANFRTFSDPLAEPNVEWKLAPTTHLDDASPRLRLKDQQLRKVTPFGVHSAKLLESLRPGGLFEYPPNLRSLRVFLARLRTVYLQVSSLRFWKARFKGIKTGALEYTLRQELAACLATPPAELPKASITTVRKAADAWIKLSTGKPADPKLITNVGQLDQVANTIRSLLNEVMPATQTATSSGNLDKLAAIPDTVVLYDLYSGSTESPPNSQSTLSHNNALRTVPIASSPTDSVSLQRHGDYHGSIRAVSSRSQSFDESEDLRIVVSAWITLHFNHRVQQCLDYFQFCATELKDELKQQSVDFHALTESVVPTCISITQDYGRYLLSPVLLADKFQRMMVQQRLPSGRLSLPKWWDKYIEDAEWARRGDGDANLQQPVLKGDARNHLFDAAIRLTISRLAKAEEDTTANSALPHAEPLLVCCIKSKSLPRLSIGASDEAPVDYLTSVYRNRWLRNRTILILDADYLRTLHDGPAGISTETSWEVTALDTVDAFQRRDHLKPYLEFGFVVVRFGVTGALLFARQPGGELTVRLFFDPNHNDRQWTGKDAGEVIGLSAVYATSIIQAMTFRCEERGSKPVYSDILETLNLSIRRAIMRCQQLCAYGYGPPSDKSGKHTSWQTKALEYTFKNNGIRDNLYPYSFYPKVSDTASAFADRLRPGDQREYLEDEGSALQGCAKWISSSIVPTVRSPHWSIVEQTCASDIERVAVNIVMHGHSNVLNQAPRTTRDLLEFESVSTGLIRLTNHIISALPSTSIEEDAAAAAKEVMSFIRSLVINNIHTSLPAIKDRQIESLKPIAVGIATNLVKDYVAEITKSVRSESDPRKFAACLQRAKQFLLSRGVEHMRTLKAVISKSKLFDFADQERPLTLYSAPIAKFGHKNSQITFIDRREVEGVAAIQKLVAIYARENSGKDEARPLSIAVFGRPGSGKSTAVKKIAEALGEGVTYADLEFNLSQFTEVSELSKAFTKVESRKPRIPLVFFDEFDSKLNETDFGWLKFFLAPMEDGRFQDLKLPPCIFVFAGGTSFDFDSFSPKIQSPSDERWIKFSRAKGPDFVSRLSGHLNIIGIDPTDPDDGIYLLRRALWIRDFLRFQTKIGTDDRAKIDDPRVLHAILHAPVYRHGGRSLRMLLKACMSGDGWIRRSNIPALHELDMMVDAKTFLGMLRDSPQRP